MQETQETQVRSLDQKDLLEEEMATHSSILARKIQWTEEYGGIQSMGWEDPLEEELATHFSSLAWKIPWTEEPGRLQSVGSQSRTRLRHTRERERFTIRNIKMW